MYDPNTLSQSGRFPSYHYVTPASRPPSRPDAPEATRRTYHYFVAEPPQGVPLKCNLLFLHGFPDCALGWGHVMAPLALSGYRCVAPELLGYGRTTSPDRSARIAEYGSHAQARDLELLMHHAVREAEQRAGRKPPARPRWAVVGHDWGSHLAWRLPLWIADRLLGVTGICVPYAAPTSRFVTTREMVQGLPQFGYQAFFEEPRSTRIIMDNLENFLTLVYSSPGLLTSTEPTPSTKPPGIPQVHSSPARSSSAASDSTAADAAATAVAEWTHLGQVERFLTDPQATSDANPTWSRVRSACLLRPEALRQHARRFRETPGGIEGALNWYRCREVTFAEDRVLRSKKLPPMPYQLLVPTSDAAIPVWMTLGMRKNVPQDGEQPGASYRHVEIEGAGHWVCLEQPNVVVAHLERWLEEEVLARFDGPDADANVGVVGEAVRAKRRWWDAGSKL